MKSQFHSVSLSKFLSASAPLLTIAAIGFSLSGVQARASDANPLPILSTEGALPTNEAVRADAEVDAFLQNLTVYADVANDCGKSDKECIFYYSAPYIAAQSNALSHLDNTDVVFAVSYIKLLNNKLFESKMAAYNKLLEKIALESSGLISTADTSINSDIHALMDGLPENAMIAWRDLVAMRVRMAGMPAPDGASLDNDTAWLLVRRMLQQEASIITVQVQRGFDRNEIEIFNRYRKLVAATAPNLKFKRLGGSGDVALSWNIQFEKVGGANILNREAVGLYSSSFQTTIAPDTDSITFSVTDAGRNAFLRRARANQIFRLPIGLSQKMTFKLPVVASVTCTLKGETLSKANVKIEKDTDAVVLPAYSPSNVDTLKENCTVSGRDATLPQAAAVLENATRKFQLELGAIRESTMQDRIKWLNQFDKAAQHAAVLPLPREVLTSWNTVNEKNCHEETEKYCTDRVFGACLHYGTRVNDVCQEANRVVSHYILKPMPVTRTLGAEFQALIDKVWTFNYEGIEPIEAKLHFGADVCLKLDGDEVRMTGSACSAKQVRDARITSQLEGGKTDGLGTPAEVSSALKLGPDADIFAGF